MSNENNGKLGVDEPTEAETATPVQNDRIIPYAPVPMSFNIYQSQGPEGQMYVRLGIQTNEGDKVFFLEPETGKQLGEALLAMSEASANGVLYTK